MSTKYIIIKTSHAEQFEIQPAPGQSPIIVSLDQGDEQKMLRTSILAGLEARGFALNNEMHDFLQFALALYTIDQTVSRQINGFQGWSRHLKVYFPVNDLARWQSVRSRLEHFIGFLSGDKWEFFFRQNEEIRAYAAQAIRNPLSFTKVSLFSGGLDSFIGAIDLLSLPNEKPFFVSHYKTGTESSAQEVLLAALAGHFGSTHFGNMRFYIQPNQQNQAAQKENTSRARSLLFITLGLTIANSIDDNMTLILPENGLISLNVPLTKTRLSSHSTRTTHPYFVNGLNGIIADLGINNRIVNPYRFKTKGEMMQECANPAFLNLHVAETVSCSHPENSRYLGKSPGLNCGYCVPCIIRQAAENKAGEITTEYALDDIRQTPPSKKLKRGSDYRAFQMALTRLEGITKSHSMALEVIRSGPIPDVADSPFADYVSVYQRGMAEVRDFLNG